MTARGARVRAGQTASVVARGAALRTSKGSVDRSMVAETTGSILADGVATLDVGCTACSLLRRATGVAADVQLLQELLSRSLDITSTVL